MLYEYEASDENKWVHVITGLIIGLAVAALIAWIVVIVSATSVHHTPPYPCPDHLTCVWGPVVGR